MILHWTSIARVYYISAIFRGGGGGPETPAPSPGYTHEYLQHFQYNTRGSVEAPLNLHKTISVQAQPQTNQNVFHTISRPGYPQPLKQTFAHHVIFPYMCGSRNFRQGCPGPSAIEKSVFLL